MKRVRRAVLVVDVVGSVRLMQLDEQGFIRRWRDFLAIVNSQVLPQFQGRLVKSLGDGMLLEFAEPTQLVEAAFELNRVISGVNSVLQPDTAITLRMGAHVADVVVDELDIYGHGVNLASRLATLGHGGELIVSAELRDTVLPGVDADIEDLGMCYLKHVEEPERAFRVGPARQGMGNLAASVVGSAAGLSGDRAGVAVIPFTARIDGPGSEALSQVLADDLIAVLSRVPGLRVVSRLSANWFALRPSDDQAVARLLQVHYVVRGTFAVRGDAIRVFVSLGDQQSDEVVWSGEFDSTLAAVLAGESPAATDAAAAVCRALVGFEVQRTREAPLHNLQSYSLLFAAISLMHRLTERDFQRAGEILRYLVARHPGATTPRAWLGKWHVLRVAQGISKDNQADARQARAIVNDALDIDSEHALALAVDGLICAYIGKDYVTAGHRYEAALRANPNEGLALLFQASLHAYQDRGAEAVQCAQKAQRLSPLDPLRYYYDNFTCLAHLAADDYSAAVESGLSSFRANRSHSSTVRLLAIAQSLSGDIAGATATVKELLKLEPASSRAGFLQRFPGQAGERTIRYADALTRAGLPDGPAQNGP